MSVAAVVYNSANTGSAIASTTVEDANGFQRGLLAATGPERLNRDVDVSITIHRSHPSASAYTPGRVVRLIDDTGEATKFTIRKTQDNVVAIDGAGETLTIEGRTLLGEWRETLLEGHQPSGVEPQSDVVAYNFATPGRDMSDFTDAGYDQSRSTSGFTRPGYWPDPFAQAVWTEPDDTTQPIGSVFAVRDFTLADPAVVVVYCSADDAFIPWLDGVSGFSKFPREYGVEHVWWKTWRGISASLPAGSHRFGIEAVNGGGAAAFWVGGWTTDTGLLGDPIFVSGADESNPFYGDWKYLGYPSTRPGCPILRPVVDFLERAQDRGAMTGWTLGFTADEDTASTAVPEAEMSFDLSKNGYDLLESLSLDYCNFTVRKGAGKILDAHMRPTGTDTGFTITQNDVESMVRRVEA